MTEPAEDNVDHSEDLGLRSIAIFEASKGILVLLAGLGLTAFLHKDAQHLTDEIIPRLQQNHHRHHIPAVFIDALQRATDINLWLLALGVCAYAIIRFIEAYGLWHRRTWAEWFAITSGAFYIPFEVYELFHHVSWMKVAIFVSNILIVGYLLLLRHRQNQRRFLI
jgi:uncharacterized membrane protein (DUF2068 family)